MTDERKTEKSIPRENQRQPESPQRGEQGPTQERQRRPEESGRNLDEATPHR